MQYLNEGVCAKFLLWVIRSPVDTNSSTTISPSITSTTAVSIYSCRTCSAKSCKYMLQL